MWGKGQWGMFNLDFYTAPYTRINSQQNKDFTVRGKNIKASGRKHRRLTSLFWGRQELLGGTQSTSHERKEKRNFIKAKHSSSKDTFKIAKRQAIN